MKLVFLIEFSIPKIDNRSGCGVVLHDGRARHLLSLYLGFPEPNPSCSIHTYPWHECKNVFLRYHLKIPYNFY